MRSWTAGTALAVARLCVFLLFVFLAFVLLLPGAGSSAASPVLPVHDGVGGDFAAQSSLGRVVHSSELRGKVVLLFFGYTSCQDICPATLSHLGLLTKELGASANDVHVVLVTVDPETDTADRLKQYLGRFDERFIGLTGTREEIDRIAALFMADHHQSHGVEVPMEHNRTPAFEKTGYLYSHSQQIYLLDKAGRTRAFFFTGSPLPEMKQAVESLLEE